MIMLIAIIIIIRKDFESEPGQRKEPFSHVFLGRARHAKHIKTERTKNTVKYPLSQWPSQRNQVKTAHCGMGLNGPPGQKKKGSQV